MAAPAVRRADFLMALAYATDLATGHSRDFALRSCVLAMRFAEVAGLDEDTRRNVYHQALLRYIGCNADTHLLAAALRRRDHASPRPSAHRHRQQVGIRRDSSSAPSRESLPDAPPEELARGGRARPCRGHAGQRPHPVRPLRGCPADRGTHRPVGRDPRKSRPALRALGWEGIAARPVGQCREVSGPAGDLGAGCHRADRAPWLRDHEGR